MHRHPFLILGYLLFISSFTVSTLAARLHSRASSCPNNGGPCNNPDAPCCSSFGYCGSGDSFCGTGCNAAASYNGICGSSSQPPPPPPSSSGSEEDQLKQCLIGISGSVVYPEDSAYATDIQDENKAKTYQPAAILYAENKNDVINAIKCTSKLNIGITPRSGGHSYESYSLGGKNGVLVVDVTNINQITIDSQAQTATIGTGNRLGQIYYNLNNAGFFIPAGSCPGVGIAGHSLGGGFGLYSRKYGLASDHIISAEIVLANGQTVTADSKNNADLFFALRGAGGGSYGIVTSLQFRLTPVPQTVTTFSYTWDVSNIHALLPAITQFTISGTPDVTFSFVWSTTQLVIEGAYIGTQDNLPNALNSILSVAQSSRQTVNQQSFIDSVVTYGDGMPLQNPYRSPYYFKAKSFFLGKDGLSSEGIDTFKQFLASSPSECNVYAILDSFGGAINSVPPEQTAFVHRGTSLGIQLISSWSDESQTTTCTDNLNTFGAPFHKAYTTGFAYQNYIDQDLENWQNAYYGSNFNRLVTIKKKYDPENIFQFQQSIPTEIN